MTEAVDSPRQIVVISMIVCWKRDIEYEPQWENSNRKSENDIILGPALDYQLVIPRHYQNELCLILPHYRKYKPNGTLLWTAYLPGFAL